MCLVLQGERRVVGDELVSAQLWAAVLCLEPAGLMEELRSLIKPLFPSVILRVHANCEVWGLNSKETGKLARNHSRTTAGRVACYLVPGWFGAVGDWRWMGWRTEEEGRGRGGTQPRWLVSGARLACLATRAKERNKAVGKEYLVGRKGNLGTGGLLDLDYSLPRVLISRYYCHRTLRASVGRWPFLAGCKWWRQMPRRRAFAKGNVHGLRRTGGNFSARAHTPLANSIFVRVLSLSKPGASTSNGGCSSAQSSPGSIRAHHHRPAARTRLVRVYFWRGLAKTRLRVLVHLVCLFLGRNRKRGCALSLHTHAFLNTEYIECFC